MKNEEFLQLLSGIDEKLIEKAGEDLENYHKAATQYASVSSSRKKIWHRITAVVCAAAVMAGVVVLVKNVGNIRGERPGVVLSEGDASMPELPIISKPESSEPDIEKREWNYFNFSISGNNNSGSNEFSEIAYKDTFWNEPATVHVYKGNISENNTAYISIYACDSLGSPIKRITERQQVDHFTFESKASYSLAYNISDIDDFVNRKLCLCVETSNEFVTFEGEWHT